jgi:hypothetical protein
MKCHRTSLTVGRLAAFGGQLLLSALADIVHAERGEVDDQARGMELGDDDARQLTGVATDRPGRVRDAGVQGGEAFGQRGHFRKSGMSRSSSP